MAVFLEDPSVFCVKLIGTVLVDSKDAKYTLYKMLVKMGSNKWEVSRRFSEFKQMLHEPLQENFSISVKGFPTHIIFPNSQFDDQFIAERQISLQKYFDNLSKIPAIEENPVLRQFLDPMHMPSVVTLKNVATMKGMLKCSYPKNNQKLCWVVLFDPALYLYSSQQASHPDYEINLSQSRISKYDKTNVKISTEKENCWCTLHDLKKENNEDQWLRLLTHVRITADPINAVLIEKLRRYSDFGDTTEVGLTSLKSPLKNLIAPTKSQVSVQARRLGSISSRSSAYEKPVVYQYQPDSEKNILFSEDGGIQAATIGKLIEKLCDSNFGIYTMGAISHTITERRDIDSTVKNFTNQIAKAVENTYEKSNFIVAFMHTFNSFMKPKELLSTLIQRFMNPPSRAMSMSELQIKEETGITKQEEMATDPNRARVIQVLCTWLEVHFYDFVEDQSLAQDLITFIEHNTNEKGISAAGSILLKDLIKSKLQTKPPEPDLSLAPVPILSACPYAGHFDICDLSPIEVARQLSLKHLALFKQITLKEFLSQNWSKKDADTLSPSIVKCMKEFNKCSSWVATYCTFLNTPKERAKIIGRFIQIAYHCLEIQNYHTVMTIISGLNNAAVNRLKKSWELISSKESAHFKEMEDLMSPQSNWSNYRNLLRKSSPPLLPYLGLFLGDLTFLEDGNPDCVGPNKLINFDKWSTESCIFQNIQKFQASLYCFRPDDEIQKYIKYVTIIDEKELYAISLKQEPRSG